MQAGVHISVLGIAFYRLLRKGARMKRGSAAFLAGIVIASYGIMTGMSISALRAIIMFLICIISFLTFLLQKSEKKWVHYE